MTTQMTTPPHVSNLRHQYLTVHRILSMIVAGFGLSLSLSGPPAWGQLVCPLGNSWCTALQAIDCNTTTTNETCLPREVTIDPNTGQPIILLCDCFSNVPGCGPVDIHPNTPPPGYTVSCLGPCPAPRACELLFNGNPTGSSSVDTSTMAPPYPAMTCACVEAGPTLCPLPASAECASLQSTDCQSTDPTVECLPKVIRHHTAKAFFPPAGTDVLTPTTGHVDILSPLGEMVRYYIRESPPNITRVRREEAVDVGGYRTVQTEIIEMELVGVAGGGGGA